jgi:hypothetical protein
VAVFVLTPEAMPEIDPIVTTAVFELVHNPPPASVNVLGTPIQIVLLPVMATGMEFTVTVTVDIHPVGKR